MIIAIDGPAGSGKSTTAKRLASRLGLWYIDTGAMYRAAALAFMRSQTPVNERQSADLVDSLEISLSWEGDALHVTLNGEDVSEAIRSPEAGQMASRVSALPSLRKKMVDEQRKIAKTAETAGYGVILDGRDIGTVVFPDAALKIFLIADLDERARRRQDEYRRKGVRVAFDQVREELAQRDQSDEERAHSPLRRADDAVVLDTSAMTIEEQVRIVESLVRERDDIHPV